MLGYDYETLSELCEEHGSDCALKLLLLWRDEQPAKGDIRGDLAEKLTEAGLADQSAAILGGKFITTYTTYSFITKRGKRHFGNILVKGTIV